MNKKIKKLSKKLEKGIQVNSIIDKENPDNIIEENSIILDQGPLMNSILDFFINFLENEKNNITEANIIDVIINNDKSGLLDETVSLEYIYNAYKEVISQLIKKFKNYSENIDYIPILKEEEINKIINYI